MNFSRSGVRAKQRALNSKGTPLCNKLLLIIIKLLIAAIIACAVWGVSLGLGIFQSILANTPTIRLSDVIATGLATIVYDKDGNEIDQYVGTNSNRIEVTWDEISPYMGDAFVAIEDERFYEHNGIDYRGLGRAFYQFIITKGKEKQGASTITQQLLKNTVFTSWTEEDGNMIKMIKRKVQEQYLSMEISKRFTKEEVLLRYMNAINLGQNTLGVESASLRYFGKHASELTLSECAVIACITQNPSAYNPIRFPEKNERRRKDCLDKMLEKEFISQAEYDEAIADTKAVYERIGNHNIDFKTSTSTTGSYFSDAVYEQVRDDLIAAGYSETLAEHALTSGGLRIYSTMDSRIQSIANEEYANEENFVSGTEWYVKYALTIYNNDGTMTNYSKEMMAKWFKNNVDKKFDLLFDTEEEAREACDTYRKAMLADSGVEDDPENYLESFSVTIQPQSACVIQDQETGYVVAMVGGRGTKEGRRTLNRVVSANRSPGSTFKVLAAFAPALDACGQTLATVYNDAPFNYDTGVAVRNWYTTGYKGICSIRDAITQSLNIVAIKTCTVITPQLAYDYLLNFGFTTLTDHKEINGKIYSDVSQSIALGGITNGVTPYEVNAAYASIANGGVYVEPKLYTKVTDSNGEVILDNTATNSHRVLKETTAYLLTSAMEDVVHASNGTGKSVNFGDMGIAGKTGSTTGYYDVWFAGYTPYYTCTVWSGYDSNGIEIGDHSQSRVLWRAIMERVHEDLPAEYFYQPPEIIECEICSRSGKLPIPGLCDACIKTEYFEEGTEPTEYCNIHYQGRICSYDGMPATENCPFAYEGYMEVPLIEPEALITGSTVITENPDGTQTVTLPRTSGTCSHDENFFANPDWESIYYMQAAEMDRRREEAAAAAAAAAAGQ